MTVVLDPATWLTRDLVTGCFSLPSPTKYHAGFILTAAVGWNTKLPRTGEYSKRASPSRTQLNLHHEQRYPPTRI